MTRVQPAIAAALAASLISIAPMARAAGGHHAVDDAAILDARQCELEGWFGRSRDSERLLHAGANCRLGPVELGLAAEHARQDGSTRSGWELQAKWARELTQSWSVGASVATASEPRARPRYQGAKVLALATWSAHEQLKLHLNLGRDFVHRGADEPRYGASLEWQPLPRWSLVGERYKAEGTHFVRAGARWLGGENWSVDVSRSHRLAGQGVSAWTVGATWAFERN